MSMLGAKNALFRLRIACVTHMNTSFAAGEIATEEAAVAVSLKHCSARLTGDAVVIALPSEVLTITHLKGDYSRSE